jgi:uncharacterized protein
MATRRTSESKTADALLLTLSEDKLSLYVNIAPHVKTFAGLSGMLAEKMGQLGFTSRSTINEAIQALEGLAIEDAVREGQILLQGTPPVPGLDGTVTWARDFFKKGFKIDPDTGRVDYRQRAADLAVHKDDFLCEVLPPEEGQDGIDVFGEPVPATKGIPIHLRAGTNVRVEGSQCMAEDSGRIRYVKGVLAVDNLYTVRGSVNLAEGNINHPGALVVRENVESQAKVMADGDIEIGGYVEDATITAEGDLHVGGGILGKTGNEITVAGVLHARFIGNAVVRAEGDVVVDKYIDNCRIYTRGKVVIPAGRIAGGEIIALGGIVVGETGSDACVPTHLVAGEDYTLRDTLKAKRDEQETLTADLTNIEQGLSRVHGKINQLSGNAKQAIAALLKQQQGIAGRLSELAEEIEDMLSASKEGAVHEISVMKRIYPASSFTVGGCIKLVQQEVSGPVKAAIHKGDIAIVARRR